MIVKEYLPIPDVAVQSDTTEPDLLTRAKDRLFDIDKKPPPIEPRYWVNRIPIHTIGNLSLITAPIKAGKSAWVGAMMAAAMTRDPLDVDTFGITTSNQRGEALIHLDTEQAPGDHYELLQRALKRARIDRPPPWLLSYCLTGFQAKEIRDLIPRLLEDARGNFCGIHSMLIDGVADAILDVNDAGDANAFVMELHGLAIEYVCPTVGVLHFNPGSEKTRGHLGSQFERKAETNLKLERDGDATIVWSDKNRRAPISKNNGPRFMWSNDQDMHVSTATKGQISAKEGFAEAQPLVDKVFKDHPSMRHTDLLDSVMALTKKSARTANRIIKDWVTVGVIKKDFASLYVKGY